MLIDHPIATTTDRLSAFICQDNGNSIEPHKLDQGIYERGDFNISAVHDTVLVDDNPNLPSGNCFGVCDNYQQIIDTFPELVDSDRKFFVTVTPVKRDAQDSDSSWRWQQWGPYIGDHERQSDCLAEEPSIDCVFVYHIYEVISQNTLH